MISNSLVEIDSLLGGIIVVGCFVEGVMGVVIFFSINGVFLVMDKLLEMEVENSEVDENVLIVEEVIEVIEGNVGLVEDIVDIF